MIIEETEFADLASVVELVGRVANTNILPHFSEEGREFFTMKVLPDVETTFNRTCFQSAKMTDNGKLIGFGAIRDKDYITHLFVDSAYQGRGLGKLLLQHLLALADADEVRLRASVNSVSFYASQGFNTTDSEAVFNGIRFVPMCWVRT
ncbi:GNAT family N-acetyltransferase [Enterovibrio calviensis]|uniref:GNAT family N-acetyltransferase n=1 Tax=Enterovibrio calviensis TaxID=91359 RepID=UPI0037370302